SSLVRLELSVNGVNGPWFLIADSLKNNGRYQWRVPETVSSRYCYIRYTVYRGIHASSEITPGPFFIGNPVSLNERVGDVFLWALRLTPNPAKNRVTLDLGVPVVSGQQIKLFDAQGRLMGAFEVSARTMTVALDRFPAGTYFVVLGNGRGNRLIVYK
ncbi:MAG: T9SS type A sorting domain-containing protein, partial [candidate division WOR-3 bacterium]